MNFDFNKENFDSKKIFKVVMIFFAVIILIAAVYASLRRTSARFSRDFLSPFLQTITLSEEGVAKSAQMLKPKQKLAAEVYLLQRKNLILESQNTKLQHLEEENKTLRALLNLPPAPGFKPVIAEICGRTAAQWRERFVINRGWSDGLKVGDAVAAPDHAGSLVMAGRITEVSAHTATVSTVFSGDCKLSVMTATDGSTGGMEILKEKSNPVVRYLPLDGDYRDNGLILTSGIADRTPGRIPVAKIQPRAKDQPPALIRDQLYAEVNVIPLIRIDSVRTVVVFTKGGTK